MATTDAKDDLDDTLDLLGDALHKLDSAIDASDSDDKLVLENALDEIHTQLMALAEFHAKHWPEDWSADDAEADHEG